MTEQTLDFHARRRDEESAAATASTDPGVRKRHAELAALHAAQAAPAEADGDSHRQMPHSAIVLPAD